MAKRITYEEKQVILAWYLNNDQNLSQTAKHFKRSKETIHRIVHKEVTKSNDFTNEVKRIKNKQDKSILDLLRSDDRVSKLMDMYLDIVTDKETLDKQLDARGLQPITNAAGMIADKVLKLKQIDEGVDLLGEGIKVNIVNDAKDH